MKQLVQHLGSLPDSQQDVLASILLEELEGEMRWDGSFEKSQDTLSSLAQQALADHEKHLTVSGGFTQV